MNEQIQELAVKAKLMAEEDINRQISYNAELKAFAEKFAELIIQECLLCCEQVISDPVPKSVDTFEQGGIHCMDEIKEHFGVGMSTEDKKNLIKELLGVKE
jgi:hypothetical protein